MNLTLERPLIFFDLETTGLNIGKDRIIEISMYKIMPDGKKIVKTEIINPQMHIPEEVSELHGFYDFDVKDKPIFEEIADDIIAFIGDGDLAGYNSNRFDIPLLMEEFLRCGRDLDINKRYCIDVQNIFHKMEPRTLKAAYKFYCNKPMENAHEAEADTKATYEVFLGQLEKYENEEYEDKDGNISKPITGKVKDLSFFSAIGRNVDYVGHIVFNDNDDEIFNFGKYKGQTVEWVFRKEPAYYDWMMKADFPLYTKKIITMIRNRMF
jgi:DNA polymerase-3 subunit epsilon